MVAAGALVPPGTVIPSGQVWAGSPAKFIRNLVEGEPLCRRMRIGVTLRCAVLCCAVPGGQECGEAHARAEQLVAVVNCGALQPVEPFSESLPPP